MSQILAKSPAPRVHALDFIRLFAIFLMIQGHTLDALVNPSQIQWDASHWKLWVHMRGVTAPLFLTVSGAVSAFGLRYDDQGIILKDIVKHRLRMALIVMTIGYLLVFPANSIVDLPWVTTEGWSYFWRVNILQLNGMSLILLTGLLRLTRSVKTYALWSVSLGLGMILLSPIADAIPWFRFLPEPIAAYFSFQRGSLFPIFPFSGYMFLGVGLGALLVYYREDGAKIFQRVTLGALLIAIVLMFSLPLLDRAWLPRHDSYRAGYEYLFLRLSITALVLCVATTLCKRLPRITERLARLGRYSLYAYVAHLVILYGTPWTPGLAAWHFQTLSVQQGLVWIPILIALILGGLFFWFWIKGLSEKSVRVMHLSAVCALAYALVF